MSSGNQVAMVQRGGRAGRGIAVAVTLVMQTLLLVGPTPTPSSAADLVWVGNDGNSIGNFNLSGNWENNTLPSWGYANSLKFQQNQNAGVTTLNYNWGEWRQVNDIFWDSTFPVSRTLSASNGGGIGYKTRIENSSYYPQTMAMEVSGGQDGASDMQLNPVNGSLTISGTIYNDNEKDYVVWGSQSGTNPTSLTLSSALGPNAAPQSLVDFTVSAGRFSNVLVNASQVWAGTTTVNSGSFITGSGVTLASSAIVVGGGTVATTSANTLADAATLTVNSGRLSIGGNDTVASLTGTGGTVSVAAGATLTAGSFAGTSGTLNLAAGSALTVGSFSGTGGTLNLAAGSTLTVGNSGSTSYAGLLTGSGNFTKVGSGTFTLSESGTITAFSGTLTVTEGVFNHAYNGGGQRFPATLAVNMVGGTLALFSPGTTIGELSGTGGTLSAAWSGVTINQNTNTTFAGLINTATSSLLPNDSTWVRKRGSGRLNLTGTVASVPGDEGRILVDSGTLAMNGMSIDMGLNVAFGSTFAGSGTFHVSRVGAPVDAVFNGTHSPGNDGPGIMTFGTNMFRLWYQEGAKINWQLVANTTGSAGVAYDQVYFSGTVLKFEGRWAPIFELEFNSPGSLVDWTDPFWNVNRSWDVFVTTTGSVTSLSNLSLGGSLLDSLGNALDPATRGSFSIAQSGQNVVLNFVAVPEPATCGLGVIGLGLAAGVSRLRRRSRARSLANRPAGRGPSGAPEGPPPAA